MKKPNQNKQTSKTPRTFSVCSWQYIFCLKEKNGMKPSTYHSPHNSSLKIDKFSCSEWTLILNNVLHCHFKVTHAPYLFFACLFLNCLP